MSREHHDRSVSVSTVTGFKDQTTGKSTCKFRDRHLSPPLLVQPGSGAQSGFCPIESRCDLIEGKADVACACLLSSVQDEH